MANDAQVHPLERLGGMIMGYWVSQAIYVAAKLELADRTHGGAKSPEELAAETGMNAGALRRLLRTLAGLGLFSGTADDRFGPTELGSYLRRAPDQPLSQWALAIMMGEEHYKAWGDLHEGIRTGLPPFDAIYGMPIFEYLGRTPEAARVFDLAMTSIHGRETFATLDHFDFSGIGTLADVGGGNGSNLVEILRRYPAMNGILFDLPHVVERARGAIGAAGLSSRFRAVAGDFFASIPVEADAYFLRHIIHDWDDHRAGLILDQLRKAMRPGARLLLVEHVLPPDDSPSFGKLLDLNMLVLPGGLERTESDFRTLLKAHGFELTKVTPVMGDMSVVESRPV